MCCQELLLQPEFFRVHVVQTYCKRPRNKIRSRTVGFAQELWQPMKSLEENEHMVRCEIQISASLKISASKKHIFSFPTKKKYTNQIPSEHTHLVSSVNSVFHQMFAKSQKKQKKHCQLYTRDLFWQNLVKISFGKVSVAPTKMDLTDSAQRDRGMTTVTQIRMTLFLVWILLVAPGMNLPMALPENVKIMP